MLPLLPLNTRGAAAAASQCLGIRGCINEEWMGVRVSISFLGKRWHLIFVFLLSIIASAQGTSLFLSLVCCICFLFAALYFYFSIFLSCLPWTSFYFSIYLQ